MSPTTGSPFPLDSFREAAPYLRRPFTAAAVKWKVQATFGKPTPTGGLIVGYIDARLVVERLNLVVPHLWHDEYQPDGKNMVCRLTVDGIARYDIGEGVGKGLYSDALKRAAVKFGVGVSLYAIPKTILNVSDGDLKPSRDSLLLTPKGEAVCRGRYAQWLETHAKGAFGDPLDHGDTEGAQGDAEVEAPPEVKARQQATPPKPTTTVATEVQRGNLSNLADELVLSPTDLADAICGAAGQPTKTFASMDKAYEWCERALERLPAKLVADVEKRLRAMTGEKVAA